MRKYRKEEFVHVRSNGIASNIAELRAGSRDAPVSDAQPVRRSICVMQRRLSPSESRCDSEHSVPLRCVCRERRTEPTDGQWFKPMGVRNRSAWRGTYGSASETAEGCVEKGR